MTVEIAVLISVVSVSFSIFFGLKSSKRTDAKDIEERARERAELNLKLDFISQNMQDIKEQISSLVKDVHNHGQRITKIEEGVKRNDSSLERLHKRVDELEDRVGGKKCRD